MKNVLCKILSGSLALFFTLTVCPGTGLCKADRKSPSPSVFLGDTILTGAWDSRETLPEGSLYQISSRTYFVDSGPIDKQSTQESFGASLNFKYYTGFEYDYLKKNFPGKTVSMKIHIPESAVSPFSPIPNRLRVTLKSSANGEWAEYFEKEWLKVKKPGTYTVKIKIPEQPTLNAHGKTFYPEALTLLAVELYVSQGGEHHKSCSFSFSDLSVSGIDLDQKRLKWQYVKNGYSVLDSFVLSFPDNSTVISSLDHALDLDFSEKRPLSSPVSGYSDMLDSFFMSLKVFIPEELRNKKGSFGLTLRRGDDIIRSATKDFSNCNLEGMVYMTIPLDGIKAQNSIEETLRNCDIYLRVRSDEKLTSETLPFVIFPPKVRQGELIPFDNIWTVRDVQGLGAYKDLVVSGDAGVETNTVKVSDLSLDTFDIVASIPLKGGISWENPYYRVELMRELEGFPLDLDNMHLEVLISPLTDTTPLWQSPYRARLGLMDINGNVIFGTNVSLSEGLPSLATLDVSTTNPIPKGILMPGFDPHKVKAVLINFEAAHKKTGLQPLKVSIQDLLITPKELGRPAPVMRIDFSTLERDPGSWNIKKLLDAGGGFLVGINYPFPFIDVPPDVLEVPQVYPIVGKKPSDAGHFGLSSRITKGTLLKDFSVFADKDIDLVRLLVLGHLDGVFTWDYKGRGIIGMPHLSDSMLQDMSGMKIETLTKFLENHETEIFGPDNDKMSIPGLEQHVMRDLFALFDTLEAIEKKTGKRLLVALSMYDFMLADNIWREGPYRIYTVGEHPEIATDPFTKVKALALMWKMMRTMSQDPRFYRYVGLIEVMNEPANATALSTRTLFPELVSFVGENIYLIKSAVGPTVPVSVGFRSWILDLRYWSSIAAGIDILVPHYWESLESYDIDKEGLWPLDTPVKTLWDYLGEPEGDRLTGMGEISPGGKLSNNLFRLEKAGYDFALIWSYSGHDGHNAKPEMAQIHDYQEGNLLSGKLAAFSPEARQKAYAYISNVDGSFTKEDLSGVTDKETRRVLALLLQIAGLKQVGLSRENCEFILIKSPERIKN